MLLHVFVQLNSPRNSNNFYFNQYSNLNIISLSEEKMRKYTHTFDSLSKRTQIQPIKSKYPVFYFTMVGKLQYAAQLYKPQKPEQPL